eukprot:7338927-Alexandrium_andersonii.AAC.1
MWVVLLLEQCALQTCALPSRAHAGLREAVHAMRMALRRPATEDHRPMFDVGRLTTHDRRTTTDDRRQTTDD